jgi:hypothetical protein
VGADASSDVLRRNSRCSRCGHHGALLQLPSHHSMELPHLPRKDWRPASSAAGGMEQVRRTPRPQRAA